MRKMFSQSIFMKSMQLGLVGLMLLAPLTGCVATEKKVSTKASLLTSEPVLDPKLVKEDFSFPSQPPQLSQGKVVFQQNCASCHGAGLSYDKVKDQRPIDTFLMITRGDKGHPSFRGLTRDERWQAIWYARYLAGEADIKNKDIAAIFGSNCAVCHGAKGFADGPLYTGHASAHELGMAPVKGAFDPPPANFHSYSRMYNRTDDQLVKFITEGVYPSAMPSWKGRVDRDKNVVFDDALIRDLVKYVRTFSYENDLPEGESQKPSASEKPSSKMLSALEPGHVSKMEKPLR